MKKYSDKLKDPKWQRKRLEILERDDFMCCSCQDDENTLHVHHKKYIYGKNPWDYENSELITLCESCHEDIERYRLEILNVVSELNDTDFLSDLHEIITKSTFYNYGNIIKFNELLNKDSGIVTKSLMSFINSYNNYKDSPW